MNRRTFLFNLAALPLMPSLMAAKGTLAKPKGRNRVRPGSQNWPNPQEWENLRQQVGGRLIEIKSPLEACRNANKSAVEATFKEMKNPYYIGDQAALTQSTGYIDAWVTKPSVYGIEAESAEDVKAGVDFARKHNLRLVVKGGGHSYHGTSCAPDSLLIWTHPMRQITLREHFIPKGGTLGEPAVTVGAGCLWMHVYQEVSVRHNRYVQGGGCGTVGVAGLVQSGGFGSFSKRFGTAASNLLEAEIVTANGHILTVNSDNHPDLFWALKGGGGGDWGVVTKLTLKMHEVPKTVNPIRGKITAKSDESFKRLLTEFFRTYRDRLMNPHWGESVHISSANSLELSMVGQGLSQEEAESDWKPFIDWAKGHPEDYNFSDYILVAIPGQSLWDVDFWKRVPGVMSIDDRSGAPKDNAFWTGNTGECGIYWHGYESVWLQQSLLKEKNLDSLVEAVFKASRSWDVELHFNKGLAGAPAEALGRTGNTATNPAVLDAFCLAIIAGGEDPCYEGVEGHKPDIEGARKEAAGIRQSMVELRKVVPEPGSYVSESSYFERDWTRAYWGKNYARLLEVKKKYDPECLFYVHHGVGTEGWSRDGFTMTDR